MPITLQARPLDAGAVAQFVTLISPEQKKATVIDSVLEPGDVPGRHAFTVLCPQPVPDVAITIGALERHPHSTQSFVPLKAGRWIVLVAPTASDGSPDIAGAMAFVAGLEDAICIHRNVWHAGLTVLDRAAEFGMIMWKADAGDDGLLHQLAQPLRVVLQPGG